MKFFYVFLVFVLSFAVGQAQKSFSIYKATSGEFGGSERDLTKSHIYVSLFSCQTNEGESAQCVALITDYQGEPLLWHKYAETVTVGIMPSYSVKRNSEGKLTAFFGTWYWETKDKLGDNFVIVDLYQNAKGHPYICFKMFNENSDIIITVDAVFAGAGFFPQE